MGHRGCLARLTVGAGRALRAAAVCVGAVLAGALLVGAAGLTGGGTPARAEVRVALVIGNGAYRRAPQLPNPSHDAKDVAAALERTGFVTILGIDLDKVGMEDATIRFARAAREADVALFYYSGHAMQFAGVNYLMPVDAVLSDEADLRRMLRLDDIVAEVQQARNLRIMVLDSCRDNPLAEELKRSIGRTRSATMSRGLAKIDAPEGMIVAYSTQPGHTAEDGAGRNSPYTAAFLAHIEAPEEIGTMFRRISADVYAATKHAQLPELSLSFIGEFYLHGHAAEPRTTADGGRATATTVAPAASPTSAAAPSKLAVATPSAPVAAPGGGYAVQIGAHRSEAEALTALHALQARFPQALAGQASFVRSVDLGAHGTYFRVMIGPYATAAEAVATCDGLKAAGGQCVVLRN